MDINVKSLLEKKVGFIKKLFKSVYSKETVIEAFTKGKSLSDKEHKDSMGVLIKENDRLTASSKDFKNKRDELDLKLKAMVHKERELSTMLNKAEKELSSSKSRITVLENEKKTLVKKNNAYLEQSKKSDTASDVKVLEKKLKDQEEKHKKELQQTLKDCTDKFMKTIKKLDKEKSALESSLNKQAVAKAPSTVKNKPAFTCAQIKKIKEEKKSKKKTILELATEYGVSKTTISRIVNGETYKDCK